MELFVRLALGIGLVTVVVGPCLALDAHDLQKDCTSTLNGPQGYVLGYVAAVVEERTMSKSPTNGGSLVSTYAFPSNGNRGEFRDAVCKYVDLHPEIWARSYHDGVTTAIDALYMNREVKPSSSPK
jgi:hypothetical protein